jgi:hypothetical protein
VKQISSAWVITARSNCAVDLSIEDGAEGGALGPRASYAHGAPLHPPQSLLGPDSEEKEMREWRAERREESLALSSPPATHEREKRHKGI